MDFRTMLEREPLKEVLIRTINEYFHEVVGKNITASDRNEGNSVPLYIFSKPFFVSYLPFPKGLDEFLYSEYNIRGNVLKYLLGKAGVFAVLHSGSALAKDKIYLCGEVSKRRFFISPCNRTVRFYYYDDDSVDVIAKSGYQNEFLKNQVYFRQHTEFSFVPGITASGDRWYREAIMHGHALARLRDKNLLSGATRQVDDALRVLGESNRRTAESRAYFDLLAVEAVSLSERIERGLSEPVRNALQRIRTTDIPVPLSTSHGDLQGGNIWVKNDGSILIYDWETVAERSVWFDPMVLFGKLHSGCFLVDILQVLDCNKQVFINDPNSDQYSRDDKKTIEALIALEDLCFCLKESAQLLPDRSVIRARSVVQAFESYFEVKRYG